MFTMAEHIVEVQHTHNFVDDNDNEAGRGGGGGGGPLSKIRLRHPDKIYCVFI